MERTLLVELERTEGRIVVEAVHRRCSGVVDRRRLAEMAGKRQHLERGSTLRWELSCLSLRLLMCE